MKDMKYNAGQADTGSGFSATFMMRVMA